MRAPSQFQGNIAVVAFPLPERLHPFVEDALREDIVMLFQNHGAFA